MDEVEGSASRERGRSERSDVDPAEETPIGKVVDRNGQGRPLRTHPPLPSEYLTGRRSWPYGFRAQLSGPIRR
jgi:hypothetical protein